MRTVTLTLITALASCGSDADPCDTCGTNTGLYGRDYVIVLYDGSVAGASIIEGSLALGEVEVARVGAPAFSGHAHWAKPVTIGVREDQHFVLLALADGDIHIVADAPRLPEELLTNGELTLTGDGASITLRAYAPDDVPACIADADCGTRARCDDGTCHDGVRCGAGACTTAEICGDGTCLANPLATPHTLTLVDAELANVDWDTGFEGTPDPMAFIYLDDVEVLAGPEQLDTYHATWNIGATKTFDPYATMRVLVLDSDIGDPQTAIDVTFPTIPYELIRDGTLTIARDGSRVTLELAP